LKRLDSRFHGNDRKTNLRTFYEIIKFDELVKSQKSRHSCESRSPELPELTGLYRNFLFYPSPSPPPSPPFAGERGRVRGLNLRATARERSISGFLLAALAICPREGANSFEPKEDQKKWEVKQWPLKSI
jgi:hypothetical protein